MNTVGCFSREATTTTFDYQDKFAPREPSGRTRLARWIDKTLQSLVFGLARRRKWFAQGECTNYTMVEINPNDVLKSIQKQHSRLMLDYNQHAEAVVLIGPEHLCLAKVEAAKMGPVSFYLDSRTRGRIEICNMPVVMIPWMSGVLVVPGDLLTKPPRSNLLYLDYDRFIPTPTSSKAD